MSMLTNAPYSTAEVNALLATIAETIPNAIGIRNDPLVSSYYSRPDVVNASFVELEKGKTFRVRVPASLDEKAMAGPMEQLGERGLDEDKATRFLTAASALQKLNSIGAWPLKVSNRPPMVATEYEVGTVAYEQSNYLGEAVQYLADTMERVDYIDIRYFDMPNKSRWRAWASFRSWSDHELASIDTSAISLHLEAVLVRRETKLRAVNVQRVAGWADQLGCTPQQMTKVLNLLSMFAANLTLTKIELDEFVA